MGGLTGGGLILKPTAVPSIIVMQDDFAGTVIDTAKWTVVNPDTPDYVISQDDVLKMDQLTTTGHAPFNYIWSEDFEVSKGSVQSDAVNVLGLRPEVEVGFLGRDAINDYITFNNTIRINKANNSLVFLRIFFEGTFIYSEAVALSPYDKTYKITYDDGTLGGSNGDIKFWYWGGAAWIQIGTTQNQVFTGSGNLRPYFRQVRLENNLSSYEFDNFFLTDNFYATQNPT